MKPLPFREVIRTLEAAGFVQVGQTGSHLKLALRTLDELRTTIVPKHREIAAGP